MFSKIEISFSFPRFFSGDHMAYFFLALLDGRGSIPFRGRNDESEPSSDDLAQKRVKKWGKYWTKRETLAVHK